MLIYHNFQKKYYEKYYEICTFTALAISTSAAENEEVMTASLGKTIKYQTK